VLILAFVTGAMAVGGPAGAGAVETCQGEPATVIGTSGIDRLTGTPDTDVAALRHKPDYFSGLRGTTSSAEIKEPIASSPVEARTNVGDIETPLASTARIPMFSVTPRR
jgi:hypothetical protein